MLLSSHMLLPTWMMDQVKPKARIKPDMKQLKHWLQKLWYQPTLSPLLWPLIPLSLIYQAIIVCRKALYRSGLLARYQFSIPVIVVGNLTVGGTGKTPLVLHIAKLLKQQGMRPGIISRGYGGKHTKKSSMPLWVKADSDPRQVGDEPLLLAKRLLSCPIVIASKRKNAVQNLLDSGLVDVVISDDGLQHEALKRDVEILVIDGKKRLGNCYCLPAGPLRESKSRLNTVDFIVCNDPITFENDVEYDMVLRPRSLSNALDSSQQQSLEFFQGKTVHALAGIGFPDRFFDLLRKSGLKLLTHAFPDHYQFQKKDIEFKDELPILLTEKDAVKCAGFMSSKHWILSVEAVVNPLLDMRLLRMLEELK